MSVCKKNRKEHVVQTFNVKINALRALKNGVSKNDVAKQFNVHLRTVQKWQKNEKKILENEYNTDEEMSRKLKRKSKLKFDIVDELTWLWFNESRNDGVPINGPQICMQARSIYIALGGTEDEFKASDGWLHKFKRRHNIRFMTVVEEKRSSNVDAAVSYHSIQECTNPSAISTPGKALNNEEMIQVIAEDEKEKENGKIGSDERNKNSDSTITDAEVIDCLEKVLAYVRIHSDRFSDDDIAALRRMNERMLRQRFLCIRQMNCKEC